VSSLLYAQLLLLVIVPLRLAVSASTFPALVSVVAAAVAPSLFRRTFAFVSRRLPTGERQARRNGSEQRTRPVAVHGVHRGQRGQRKDHVPGTVFRLSERVHGQGAGAQVAGRARPQLSGSDVRGSETVELCVSVDRAAYHAGTAPGQTGPRTEYQNHGTVHLQCKKYICRKLIQR